LGDFVDETCGWTDGHDIPLEISDVTYAMQRTQNKKQRASVCNCLVCVKAMLSVGEEVKENMLEIPDRKYG